VWSALAALVALAYPGAHTWFVISALAVLGFALAPIYPLAMHDTPRRFGAAQGGRLVGRQVAAAALGVASLPWLLGVIAQRSSLTWLPAMLTLLALALIGLERLRR
jgi:fucose permease